MSRPRAARRWPPSLVRIFPPLAAVLVLGGCQLFHNHPAQAFLPAQDEKSSVDLPAVRPNPAAVALEIVFVERPADDPLLAADKLWEGIDTVGQIDPAVRRRLTDRGFLVGLASATPNPAIETMLGLTAQSSGARAPVDRRRLAGRRVFRPEGGATEVQTSRPCALLPVSLPGDRPREFRNARCVLRVTAERLEDGWAKLQFTPEIHHGRLGWRPMATTAGWQGSTSQRIYRFYDQRFSVTLNTGEMAVITADPQRSGSLGTHFFTEGSGSQRVQRVLIVRLSGTAERTSAGKW